MQITRKYPAVVTRQCEDPGLNANGGDYTLRSRKYEVKGKGRYFGPFQVINGQIEVLLSSADFDYCACCGSYSNTRLLTMPAAFGPDFPEGEASFWVCESCEQLSQEAVPA